VSGKLRAPGRFNSGEIAPVPIGWALELLDYIYIALVSDFSISESDNTELRVIDSS
jgi:hypothetical protein